MTDSVDLPVPATDDVFLGVAAGNFHDADLALWRVKHDLAGKSLTPAQQAHVDQLRQRRKDTYADLVIWVMTVEAQRMETNV